MRQQSFHCVSTFFWPLKVKRLRFLLCRMFPNTGSTIANLVANQLGGTDNAPQQFNPYTLLCRVTIAKGISQ